MSTNQSNQEQLQREIRELEDAVFTVKLAEGESEAQLKFWQGAAMGGWMLFPTGMLLFLVGEGEAIESFNTIPTPLVANMFLCLIIGVFYSSHLRKKIIRRGLPDSLKQYADNTTELHSQLITKKFELEEQRRKYVQQFMG